MKLSELYEHKADYEKMMAALDGYRSLPCVESALADLDFALSKCRYFEKWRIDLPLWDESVNRINKVDINTIRVSAIHNQRTDDGVCSSHKLTFDSPREFLFIGFSHGPYMFGDDYPVALFEEMYSSLKAKCPPKYEDWPNHKLYYTPDSAADAYAACEELCAEYMRRYAEGAKERKIAALERELAQLKGV